MITTSKTLRAWAALNLPEEDKGKKMGITYNGMLATELGNVPWQKSQHSNPNGACVELAALPNGEIAMRNSRFPAGAVLLYTQAEITAFLAGAKDGEFDNLLTRTTSLPPSNNPTRRHLTARQQRIGNQAHHGSSGLQRHGRIRSTVELSRKPLSQAADHMGDWSTPRRINKR
jgi:Domain of unknown function (DUF397)